MASHEDGSGGWRPRVVEQPLRADDASHQDESEDSRQHRQRGTGKA